MSGSARAAGTRDPALGGVGSRLARELARLAAYRPPLRQARFWSVQALVLAIAGLHLGAEIITVRTAETHPLAFVPTALYFIPVVYAALSFGSAGAMPTAAWCTALALPNLLVYHSGLERVGELLQLVMVNVIAVFAGQRVDWEMRARQTAYTALAESRASETKYRALFRSSPSPILLLGPMGVVREANPAAGVLFDATPQSLAGLAVEDLVGPTNAATLKIAIESGQRMAAPFAMPRPNGPDVDLEPWLTPIGDAADATVQVVLRDVTEERRRSAGLRAYAAYVLRAQEEERRRIASELHDETVQRLVLLCRELEDLQRISGGTHGPVEDGIGELRRSVESVVASLRSFARDLRPPTLDDLGLVASVGRLVADVADRAHAEGELTVIGEARRLSPHVELTSFRIAQQALRNVERHAFATRLDATLTFAEHELHLEIQDDGVGFALPSDVDLAATGHLGLLGMRERAEMLGGRLKIRSQAGAGTTITASIPTAPTTPGPSTGGLLPPAHISPGS